MIIIQDKKFWIRLFLISLFLLVVCPNFVSAQPPFVTEGAEVFTEGLALDFYAIPVAKINSGLQLSIHTYNLSDGLIISAPTSSCKVHLFFPNGTEMEVQYAVPNEDHFMFEIDENNITEAGYYPYSLQCNTSRLGGFRSGGFWANYSGLLPPSDFTRVFFIVSFVAILILIIITTFLLVKHMEKYDVGLMDVIYMFSIYITVFSLKYFNMEYMGSYLIDTFSDLFITVGAFTHIIIPIIIFVVCFMKRRLELKEEEW